MVVPPTSTPMSTPLGKVISLVPLQASAMPPRPYRKAVSYAAGVQADIALAPVPPPNHAGFSLGSPVQPGAAGPPGGNPRVLSEPSKTTRAGRSSALRPAGPRGVEIQNRLSPPAW
jgi:hypothetical protein